MTAKQRHCGENEGHDWQDTGKPQRHMEWFHSLVRIPVQCRKCRLQAIESYIYSDTLTQNNQPV